MIWVWMALSWAVIGTLFAWALTAKWDDENVELPRAKRVEHVRIVHRDAA